MATSAVDTADLPHDNLQVQAYVITFIFPCIATVALALRLYSRSMTRSFAADDWVICIAMVFYWAETYTTYKVVVYNFVGYHVWDLPAGKYDPVLGGKYGYATELLYNPILALVKTSILLFLLRLTGQKSNVRRTIIGILIFNAIMMVTTFLLTTFQCIPIAANWSRALYPDAICMNFADFVTGTASVAVFTDVLVLLMPTWIVYNLQIHRKQKLMLVGVLSFGFIAVIIGIVRIILLDAYDRHIPYDYSYSLLFCISTIEVGITFVCACAPAFKPIIVRMIPRIFGDSSRSRSTKKSIEGYGQGRTGRRPEGYEMSRRRTTHHTAEIGAGDIVEGDYEQMSDITDVESGHGNGHGNGKGDEMPKGMMGIAVRTDTEVKWHDNLSVGNGNPVRKSDSSTENLVIMR